MSPVLPSGEYFLAAAPTTPESVRFSAGLCVNRQASPHRLPSARLLDKQVHLFHVGLLLRPLPNMFSKDGRPRDSFLSCS
jgi:hypothetical protein